MANYITVPYGKQVRFKIGGQAVEGTEDAVFLLEEDVVLTMSSIFNEVYKASTHPLLSMLGKVFENDLKWGAGFLSGQFKQFGFQAWTSTQPLKTSFTLGVSMKNNAYKDVVVPVLSLAKLCLPGEDDMGGLIPPGIAIDVALQKKDKGQEGTTELGSIITKGKQLNCYLGNYFLQNVIIEQAQPTFSKFIDNHGYPINAKIRVDVTSLFTATTKMIDTVMKGM